MVPRVEVYLYVELCGSFLLGVLASVLFFECSVCVPVQKSVLKSSQQREPVGRSQISRCREQFLCYLSCFK